MLVLLAGALHSCKSNADDFDGKVLYVPLLKDQKTELPTYDGYWTSVDTVVLESSTTECLVDRISSARFTDKHIFIPGFMRFSAQPNAERRNSRNFVSSIESFWIDCPSEPW